MKDTLTSVTKSILILKLCHMKILNITIQFWPFIQIWLLNIWYTLFLCVYIYKGIVKNEKKKRDNFLVCLLVIYIYIYIYKYREQEKGSYEMSATLMVEKDVNIYLRRSAFLGVLRNPFLTQKCMFKKIKDLLSIFHFNPVFICAPATFPRLLCSFTIICELNYSFWCLFKFMFKHKL